MFRKIDDETRWLITRSAPGDRIPKSVWRLPKGWIDDEDGGVGPVARGERRATEEELQAAALRETKEEGGVEAEIIKKIGTEKYIFPLGGEKIMKFVTFYLMRWIRDVPDGHDNETQEVGWFEYDKALDLLAYRGEKEMLKKAKELVDSGI